MTGALKFPASPLEPGRHGAVQLCFTTHPSNFQHVPVFPTTHLLRFLASKTTAVVLSFLVIHAHLLKMLCGRGRPVQTAIADPSIHTLLPSILFMISPDNCRRSIQPTLQSATHFSGALSWKFGVVKLGVRSYMTSYNSLFHVQQGLRPDELHQHNEQRLYSLTLVVAVLSDHRNLHPIRSQKMKAADKTHAAYD